MTVIEACVVLGQLKFFPSNPDVIMSIADRIQKYVPAEKIEAFVESVCERHDEWPGPATFAAECRAFGDSDGTLKTWRPDYSEQLADKPCDRCGGWGHVLRNGYYDRCSCEAGYALDSEFLQLLNNRTEPAKRQRSDAAEPVAMGLQPITQSDIERAIEQRKKGGS